jgi:hypothetical protein
MEKPRPQVGDIWAWYGREGAMLLLEEVDEEYVATDEICFLCLNLLSGEKYEMYFHRAITEGWSYIA